MTIAAIYGNVGEKKLLLYSMRLAGLYSTVEIKRL
jgi:hypothetical protein